jgi:hypothetical protein
MGENMGTDHELKIVTKNRIYFCFVIDMRDSGPEHPATLDSTWCDFLGEL